MDKFDQYMERMKGLGSRQFQNLVEDKKKCVCISCSSYNECAARKRELLFCLLGNSSDCNLDELGCICPNCPVAAELDLKNSYYCTQGSEKQMRQSKQ
ncbi:MAG: DUF2769 domain-containing protein [Methanomassiliicoccales archaeon]|jgi:hypothetical protein